MSEGERPPPLTEATTPFRISNRRGSGYDWVTEILVWGYAPAGGRRPLFRVWGYAPTRESVISHILSHTMARRGHGLRILRSLPWTFTERAPRSTWWRTSRPITSRSSRCCRRIQPAPTSSARSRIQDTGRGQPGVLRTFYAPPGLSRPYSYHLWKVAVQGYGGMLCRAATRPSTVYGGMPVGLFGHPIIP